MKTFRTKKNYLIQNANDSIVISHSADVSSYKKRNYYMVDHAEYIIGDVEIRVGGQRFVYAAFHFGPIFSGFVLG